MGSSREEDMKEQFEWVSLAELICVRCVDAYMSIRHRKCVSVQWWWWDTKTSQLRCCAGMSLFVKPKVADSNLKWQVGEAWRRLQQRWHSSSSSFFFLSRSHWHGHNHVHSLPPASFSFFLSYAETLQFLWSAPFCICDSSDCVVAWAELMTGQWDSEPQQQALLGAVQAWWQRNIITHHPAGVNAGTNRMRQHVTFDYKTNSGCVYKYPSEGSWNCLQCCAGNHTMSSMTTISDTLTHLHSYWHKCVGYTVIDKIIK